MLGAAPLGRVALGALPAVAAPPPPPDLGDLTPDAVLTAEWRREARGVAWRRITLARDLRE